MRPSITRRLLLSNLVVLVAFLGLAGSVLDRAFRISSEAAAREQLRAHVYTLLATADEDERGRMRLPEAVGAPAFNSPDSGLYAEVEGEKGTYHWRSGSMIGKDRRLVSGALAGESLFRLVPGLAIFEQGISWEDDAGNSVPYALAVAIDTRALIAEQQAFRGTLWAWLGGVAVLLLAVQTGLARWGLAPLRAMSSQLRRIEDGESSAIEGEVPRELAGLSRNLNSLIHQNRTRQERVRNSLADLAHSMKTPLAVLRGSAEQCADGELRRAIVEQSERIDQIVSYQRQRAAVAGVSSVTRVVDVVPVLRRLVGGLDKVNRERGIHCTLSLPTTLNLRADQGDLFELFGNLLENAYKHATSIVTVDGGQDASQISIRIDDDGPGIADSDIQRLLRRGERADQRNPGEGIGLAVVDEIVRQYGGTLRIQRAAIGGASILVRLPV
ncbi:MAG: GHKL domain-containing protein [Gammaproteobacteria bacterium]|nr:GHKL domain-containing protein [Gammaproteobacteria bacterium]